MPTAVLYARYSSHQQREVSIDDQLKACRVYCAQHGYNIVNEYHDSAMTGTNDRRPAFQRMINNAPESDFVVVYQMDRFSRDAYDAPYYKRELRLKGVTVLSATEAIDPDTPESILQEKLLEGIAAYYSKDLSRKVKRGLDSNAQKCMANGVHLFGYDVDPDTQKFIINEEQADIVLEVFTRYASGEPAHHIADDLAKRGVRAPKGGPAQATFVQRMIKNRKYIGEYKWGDIIVPNGVPAIVPETLFDKAQKVIPTKHRKVEEWGDYPLVGKLYCGMCGKPMHGECGTGKKGTRYDYYACQRGSGCEQKMVRREVIEEPLRKALLDFANNEEKARVIARHICENYRQTDDTPMLESRLLTLDQKRERLLNLYIDGGVDAATFKAKDSELLEQKAVIESELRFADARNAGLTEELLVEFLLHGFASDDENVLYNAYMNHVVYYGDHLLVIVNLTREDGTLDQFQVPTGSNRKPLAGLTIINSNTKILTLPGAIGILIPIAA